jgi:hypothetical protein
MPIPLRPLDTVVGPKWKNRASAAATDYASGVSAPLRDWATNAAAAEGAWKQGVTDAAARGAFGAGVRKAGTGKWQGKATTLGARRYPEGVAAAEKDYVDAFKPYYDALSKIELTPRGPRGDPRNYDRVKQIGDALRKVKTGATK